MNRKKYFIFLVMLLMIVGYAGIATVLFINGDAVISVNEEDFQVYFSNAVINGEKDLSVIRDDKNIVFNHTFKSKGETYSLQYSITNGSTQYDAKVHIECTGGNNYVVAKNNWENDTVIDASATKTGTLVLELKKVYAGDELNENFSCNITASALERTTPVIIEELDNTLTGTVKKDTGTSVEPVTSGNLVFFSENKKLSSISSEGEFRVSGLEDGKHEVYYLGNLDPRKMSKEEIVSQAIAHGDFRTDVVSKDLKLICNPGKCTGKEKFLFSEFEVIESVEHSFANDSWETIGQLVHSGNYPYKVGDTKTVDMGIFGYNNLRIVNTSECTNGETSETACGFVVEFENAITSNNFSSGKIALVNNYDESSIRSFINNDIYNALPSDLQSIIATTKIAYRGSKLTGPEFVNDKLYLLSGYEVLNNFSIINILGSSKFEESTRQLDYYSNCSYANNFITRLFTNDKSATCNVTKRTGDGIPTSWWLRSRGTIKEYSINSSNNIVEANLSDERGVSPAFRII